MVVVDKAAEVATTSRAAVIHARTLEALRGIDVSDELVRRGLIVPRFTVRDRDRALMTIDFDGLPTAHAYTADASAGHHRGRADRPAAPSSAAEVHRPYELARLAQDADGVTATDGRR